jgi:hypothetical protein
VKVLAVIVVGSIASLKIAVTFALKRTPLAPSSGAVEVTAGTWVAAPPGPLPVEVALELDPPPPVEAPAPVEVVAALELPVCAEPPPLVELAALAEPTALVPL